MNTDKDNINPDDVDRAKEEIRKLDRPHSPFISERTLRLKLKWPSDKTQQMIDYLIKEGTLGPKQQPGYPVLERTVGEGKPAGDAASTSPMGAPDVTVAAIPPAAESHDKEPTPAREKKSKAVQPSRFPEGYKLPVVADTRSVKLCDIVIEAGVQPREKVSSTDVLTYAASMKAGIELPPITLFQVGENRLILSDGAHRVEAAKQLGWTELRAEIRSGTLRDAQLYAIHSNTEHGKTLTNTDKRRVAIQLLFDEHWYKWSDVAIGYLCGFSSKHVGRLRKKVKLDLDNVKDAQDAERQFYRDGQVWKMRTEKLGRRQHNPNPRSDQLPGLGAKTTADLINFLLAAARSLLGIPATTRQTDLQQVELDQKEDLRNTLEEVINILPGQTMREAA